VEEQLVGLEGADGEEQEGEEEQEERAARHGHGFGTRLWERSAAPPAEVM
jgi:hypothetical protein